MYFPQNFPYFLEFWLYFIFSRRLAILLFLHYFWYRVHFFPVLLSTYCKLIYLLIISLVRFYLHLFLISRGLCCTFWLPCGSSSLFLWKTLMLLISISCFLSWCIFSLLSLFALHIVSYLHLHPFVTSSILFSLFHQIVG